MSPKSVLKVVCPKHLSDSRHKLPISLHNHIINCVKIQLLHTIWTQDLQPQLLCCTNHSYWLISQSVAHGQVSSKTLKSAVLACLRRETEIYKKEPLSSEWEKTQAPWSTLTPSATKPAESSSTGCFCSLTEGVCWWLYPSVPLLWKPHQKHQRKEDRSDTAQVGILETEARK